MGFINSLNPFRKGSAAELDEPADVGPFAPRDGGFYQGTSAEGAEEPVRYLRFTGSGTVFEVVDVGAAEMAWLLLNDRVGTSQSASGQSTHPGHGAPDNENVLGHGDYTSAGSFLITRRFERPVVYTVLDSQPAGFRARCTDTARGTSSCYQFAWLDPDGQIPPPTSLAP